MRRALHAGIGALAVFILGACNPDQPSREPLAPTVPSLGQSQQCAGQLASNISKQQKALFTGGALTDVEAAFDAVSDACPLSAGDAVLQGYIETLILNSQAPTDANRAGGLVSLLGSVTLYATGTSLVRPAAIFQTQGGAAVLSPGEFMTSWDSRARLEVQAGTLTSPAVPGGPHLWTLEPRPTSECDGTTSLRITGNCYQIHDYPDETVAYSPPFIVTLCLHSSAGATAIGHQAAAFNGKAEVLPEPITGPTFSCAHTASALDSWLGREAGPLGRAVAKAYDYLRPRPLFADDAGESGLGLFTSLFGGVLNDIFSDNFNDPANFNDGVDTPDLGDAWLITASSPGFIQIQPSLGDMTDSVVVLSQAQGACNNCPAFRLLGTRVNAGDAETIGTYEITWTQLQNKPNIKEAPFVVLSGTGANAKEVARLSYVTESNQNFIRYNGAIVRDANNNPIFWTQNVGLNFKITVRLQDLNTTTTNYRTSLAINGTTVVSDAPFVNTTATTFTAIGYVLTGIDAGIIASDNWRVTRLSDNP